MFLSPSFYRGRVGTSATGEAVRARAEAGGEVGLPHAGFLPGSRGPCGGREMSCPPFQCWEHPPWPSLSLPSARWHIQPKFASRITSGYSWLISLFWRENANEARQLVLSSWRGVMEGPEAYLIRGSHTRLLRQALAGGERGGCGSSGNRWPGR